MMDRFFVVRIAAAIAIVWLAAQPLAAAERYRFRCQPPRVGDEMSKEVDIVLDLLSGTQQDGVPIGEAERQMHRTSQQRRVTVLAAPSGLATKVRINYPLAEQTTRIGPGDERRVTQPVSEKTYVAERVGDEVVVTDLQGRTPSAEEVAIVRRHMSALGRQNPLGQFLDGKVVALGETIRLPSELATELLGLAGGVGEATLVELTLIRVRHVEGTSLATFETRLEGRSHTDGKMDLRLNGRLIVDADTCRIAGLNLFGPASIFERRGTALASFTMTAAGTLHVSIRSGPARPQRR